VELQNEETFAVVVM